MKTIEQYLMELATYQDDMVEAFAEQRLDVDPRDFITTYPDRVREIVNGQNIDEELEQLSGLLTGETTLDKELQEWIDELIALRAAVIRSLAEKFVTISPNTPFLGAPDWIRQIAQEVGGAGMFSVAEQFNVAYGFPHTVPFHDTVTFEQIISGQDTLNVSYEDSPYPAQTKDYILDGLILCLEGINKPVFGEWPDSSGTDNHVRLINFTGGNRYDEANSGYVFAGWPAYGVSNKMSNIVGSQALTIEIVFNWSGTVVGAGAAPLWFGNESIATGNGVAYWFTSFYRGVSFVNFDMSVPMADVPVGQMNALSFSRAAGSSNVTTDRAFLVNGNPHPGNANTGNVNIGNSTIKIGYGQPWSGDNRPFIGTIHAVRVYNRRLTEAEQLHNYAADVRNYDLV
jgi:hypothetical protein